MLYNYDTFGEEGSITVFVRSLVRNLALVALIVVGAGLESPTALAQRLGVNAAVNPEAMGIPPSALPRRLVLGQEVVFNERITTGLEGQTQILFVDQSTMSVGPNSDLVVDEFVYDPAAGTGKMAASLTRGVLRFVGGKLSKQENAVSLRTPSATIGIRGGVVLVNQAAGGGLEVIFAYGKGATVTGLNGISQTIIRPGWEVTLSGPGAAPSAPAPAPPGAAAALLAQLDGLAGKSGGATTIPTDTAVANSGVGQAIQQSTPPAVVPMQPPNVNYAVQLAQSQLPVTANQPTIRLSASQARVTIQQTQPQELPQQEVQPRQSDLQQALQRQVQQQPADLQQSLQKQALQQQAELQQSLQKQALQQQAELQQSLQKHALQQQADLQQSLQKHALQQQADLQKSLQKQALQQQAELQQSLQKHALQQQADLQQSLQKQALQQQADLQQSLQKQALQQQADLQKSLQKHALQQQADLQQSLQKQALQQQADLQQSLQKHALQQQADLQKSLQKHALQQQADLQQSLQKQALQQQADLQKSLQKQALRQQADLQQSLQKQALQQQADLQKSLQKQALRQQADLQQSLQEKITTLYAGIFKGTSNSGSTLGFIGQTAPAQFAFTDGMLVNGVLSTALGGAGQLTIPLVPGTASFGSSGTASPLGPVSGTSYLSPDGSFFYANLTPVNSPNQREFVAGGLPVSANALAATGSTRIIAFTVQPDAALQSNIPFIRNNAGGNLANAYVSPLYLVAPANTAIGEANARSRTLQASLAISGQGANQQSVLVTSIGSVLPLQSSGQPVASGVVRGTSQLTPTTAPVRIGSAFSSAVDGKGNSLYGATTIAGFVLDQTNYHSANGQLTTPVIPSTASEVPLSGAATNYGFSQPATAASLTTGVGANRTGRIMKGYFGGVMNTTAQTDPYVITGKTSLTTDAANNRVAATLTSNRLAASATGGVSRVKMEFGGLTGSGGGREVFVDDNIYGAVESGTKAQQINREDLVVNGDMAEAGKLYLLSSGAAPPPTSLLPSGSSYCECKYLQWGYWGGDLRTGNSTDNTISRIDRGGINFWTAGQITPTADIRILASQGAIGSYNGHMIGSVFNNGAQYMAAGGLAATYNFATRAGSFAVNNYDGRSFTVSGSSATHGANYKFAITTVPGITGAINGSFYGPMAAETGGNFAFKTTAGPTYLTSGIFAAKR